jgi:hypothetical protein
MKRRLLVWSALLVVGLARPSRATDYVAERALAVPPTHWRLDVDLPLSFGQRLLWDTAFLVTEPARWESPEWARFGLFAGAAGAAFGADRTIDIESRIRHPRSSSEGDFENGVEEFGSLPGIVGVAGGSALIGWLTEDQRAREISIDSGEAVLVSGLLTGAMKEMTGRSRPRDAGGPFSFHPFSGNDSFPSGHTTTAFALASVVSEHFENRLWVAVPLYGLAGLVALARTRADAHFASDVLVGAAIGTASGRRIVALERERLGREQSSSSGPSVSIEPALSRGFSGLEVTLRY